MRRALLLVPLALLLVILWTTWRGGAPDAPGVAPEEPGTPAAVDATSSGRQAEPSRSEARTSVEPIAPSLPTAGSVVVRVSWSNDDTPAAQTGVQLVALRDAESDTARWFARAVTDSSGSCRFTGVPAGTVSVQPAPGGVQEAIVRAGATTEVEISVEASATVLGQVVDPDGAWVADAGVWVSGRFREHPSRRPASIGGDGMILLRTDPEGRFQLRISSSQTLCAFKEGYGPSLTAYPGIGRSGGTEPVELVLKLRRQGAGLTVTVRDDHGAPISGAEILAGSETTSIVTIEPPRAVTPGQRATTDGRGQASVPILPVNERPLSVQVRAMGYGPYQGDVELAPGADNILDVTLHPGAVVAGTVLDGAGAPVIDAAIHTTTQGVFLRRRTSSDEDGAFRLVDLPAGDVELAASRQGVGKHEETLILRAGETREWQPRLTVHPAITGVVLDLAGHPVAGASVWCYRPLGSSPDHTKTDERGRFVLGPLDPALRYQVGTTIPAEPKNIFVTKEGVAPETELVLQATADRVPSASVRGRLLTPDGEPANHVTLMCTPMDGSAGHMGRVNEDGTFQIGPRPPGAIHLSVQKGMNSVADLGVHDLQAGQQLDLGDLTLPRPATVHLRSGQEDFLQGACSVYCDGRFLSDVRVREEPISWDWLPPGRYDFVARRGGDQPAVAAATLQLREGETRYVDLKAQRAHRQDLAFEVEGERLSMVTLVIRDAGGTVLCRSIMGMVEHGGTDRALLPVGEHELILESRDGRTATVRATIPSAEPILFRVVQ